MSEEAYLRFRSWETCISLSGCLSMVIAGMSVTWPSPLTAWYSSKESEVPMTDQEVSWMVSIVPIGAVLASIPCGMLADIWGRKTILLAAGITSAMSRLLIEMTRSKWTLYVAQVIGGIVLGGMNSVAPIYISEISPPQIRGTIASQLNTMFYVGQLIVYALGPQLSYTNYLRVCSSIPIFFIIFFGFAPESPYYLMSQGLTEEAQETMAKLRGKDSVADLGASKKVSLEEKSTDKPSIWEMLKRNNYMKHMIYLQIIACVCALNGSSAMSLYAVEFLGGQWVAVVMSSVYIASSFVGAFLADPIGRKPLLVSSQIGTAICTSLVAAYFIYQKKILLYIGLFGFCFVVSFGVNLCMVTLPSELFPTRLRAFANGLSQLINNVASFICIKIFIDTNQTLGIQYNFFLYTIISLIGAGVGCLLPETAKSVISAS